MLCKFVLKRNGKKIISWRIGVSMMQLCFNIEPGEYLH